jgi:hypothetical protein
MANKKLWFIIVFQNWVWSEIASEKKTGITTLIFNTREAKLNYIQTWFWALYIVTSLLAIGGCGNHGTFQSRNFHLVKPAYLSMKEGSLFCLVCHAEISQTMVLLATLLVSLESSQWVGGAPTWFWFETLWSYSVEAIDYWNHFLNEN